LISFILKKGNPKDYPTGIKGEGYSDIKDMVDKVLKSHNKSFSDFRYIFEFGDNQDETEERPFSFNNFGNITYSAIMVLAKECNTQLEEL
jgi:hypothetical protein